MKALLVIFLFFITSNTFAETSYQGIALQNGTYTDETFNVDINPKAVVGKYGSIVDDNFSYEFQIVMGTTPGKKTISNVDVDIDVEFSYGFFLKPSINLGSKANAYALIWISKGNLTASSGNVSIKESKTDLSLGGGVLFKIDDSTNLFVEMITYVDQQDYKYAGFNIGVNY